MSIEFRWNEWNLENATKRGVSIAEAERLVLNAVRPYPKKHDAGKWLVVGRGNSDRPIEIVFVYDDDRTRDIVYILHAMPTAGHRNRRRKRGR